MHDPTVTQIPTQATLMLVALVHLAWTGAIAGTHTAAVAIDALGGPRVRRFAPAVAALGRLTLVSTALLEVTAAALLLLARVRYAPYVQTGGFWAGVLLPLVFGLALLGLYGSSLEAGRWPSLRPAIGLAGIALVVTSCGVVASGAGALLQPEGWPTSEPFYRFLPTWYGTGRFVELTLASFAATGVLIAWAGEREEDAEVVRFARRFGGGVAIVSALAWPLATLFTHFNLPDIALSPPVWALAASGIALAGLVAALAALGLGEARSPRAPLVLAVAALFGTMVAGDHASRERAVTPATLAGVLSVAAPAAPRAGPAEGGGRLAAGQAVFDRLCHLCHRFDVKLVGPPFDATVPKYRKDPEALKAFIRNPVKKDPAFPAMPKPAVTDAEVDAVAAWLLEKAAP